MKSQLVFLDQCFGYVFDFFYRLLEEVVFPFEPHTPHMYKWTYFRNTSGIVNHQMMLWVQSLICKHQLKKFVMVRN